MHPFCTSDLHEKYTRKQWSQPNIKQKVHALRDGCIWPTLPHICCSVQMQRHATLPLTSRQQVWVQANGTIPAAPCTIDKRPGKVDK